MGISELLKQAQKFKAKVEELQKEMASRTVEASSGGGMVKVKINGKQELLSLEIDPEVWATGDKELIQDLIIAAVNEGIKRSQEIWFEELKKLTGGLPLGGLL